MIKVVLFDLDGTLLNRHESVINFIEHQYERYFSKLFHIPKNLFISRFISLDQRGYVWKDKVYSELIKEFSIKNLTYIEMVEDYLQNFKHHCVPFPNLNEMLIELQNKSCELGIITNGKGIFQLENIRTLGIEHYFKHILISETEGVSKPNPYIFQKAINFFNVLPNECVYIGDHPHNDYTAARKIGMHAVWKKDSYWENFEADHFIKDLSEIPSTLEIII